MIFAYVSKYGSTCTELLVWNILYTNSPNWKLEYSNIQKITNSRLNLYHSFIIPLECQYWVFFSFFFLGSLALLCHRAKMKETGKMTLNMRPSGRYQFPKLTKNFCTQFRVCWIPRCMPWLHFSQKMVFYFNMMLFGATFHFVFEKGPPNKTSCTVVWDTMQ